MNANTRRIYETAADRNRQSAILKLVARHFGMTATEMPPLCGYDGELADNAGTAAIVEIKCRTISSTRYTTFMLCAEKYTNLRRIARTRKLRALLVVAWTDRIAYWDATDRAIPYTRQSGREDRNDPSDLGPVVNIHHSNFSTIPSE